MQKYKEIILYAVFVIVVIIWLFTRITPLATKYIDTKKDIKVKTAELADLERKVETLKAADLQGSMEVSVEGKKIYKPMDGVVDPEAAFASVLDDIIEFARFNGIKIRALEYVYNPPEDPFVAGDPSKYNVCQLNLRLIADYTDFQNFLKDLYKYPYLMNFVKVELKPYDKNKKILLIILQLRLYASK